MRKQPVRPRGLHVPVSSCIPPVAQNWCLVELFGGDQIALLVRKGRHARPGRRSPVGPRRVVRANRRVGWNPSSRSAGLISSAAAIRTMFQIWTCRRPSSIFTTAQASPPKWLASSPSDIPRARRRARTRCPNATSVRAFPVGATEASLAAGIVVESIAMRTGKASTASHARPTPLEVILHAASMNRAPVSTGKTQFLSGTRCERCTSPRAIYLLCPLATHSTHRGVVVPLSRQTRACPTRGGRTLSGETQ